MGLNLVFSLLAIFHLTYLGSMFDPGVDEQQVEEVGAPGHCGAVSPPSASCFTGSFSWCLLVLAGVPGHPHHPQVGPAQLGQSLGGARLLALLPAHQVRRSEGPHTHTHTPGLRWVSLRNTKDGTYLELCYSFLYFLYETFVGI